MKILSHISRTVSRHIVRRQIARQEKQWAVERGDQCLLCGKRGNYNCAADECAQILAIDCKNQLILGELRKRLEEKS